MNNIYDDSIKLWKEAYTKIQAVCEKYADFKDKDNFDDIHDMGVCAKNHLMLIDWYEKYGLKIDHYNKPYSYNYFKLTDYLDFHRYGDAAKEKAERNGKYISWPDDDRQPMNEWLLQISFPTGAYIFGEDYDGQQALFQDFFNELKSYKPDFLDSTNHSLYWKLENAKSVHDEFTGVLNKYRERNQSELNQRKAEELRRQLKALEEVAVPNNQGVDHHE